MLLDMGHNTTTAIGDQSDHVLLDMGHNRPDRIHDAYRLIAPHLFGRTGELVYQMFDWINENYFDGAVPETLILIDITEHGHTLGWCRSSKDGPPIIKLHPSTLCPSRHANRYRGNFDECWGVPRALLGKCYMFDVLCHEMMHAHVNYNLGGWQAEVPVLNGPTAALSLWTSHNCPLWVNECNRIGALMGLEMDCQMTCNVREGKKVKRINRGNCEPEHFPENVPGRHAFYLGRKLPFDM